MAELRPVTGVAKVIVNGAYATGTTTANIFHVDRMEHSDSSFPQAQLDALATGIRAAFVTHFCPLIVSHWSLGVVEVVDLTDDLGLVGSVSGTTAGAKSGGSIPQNVAQVVSWRIGRHYRGGHPRTYLPSPGTTDIANANSWTTTHRTALENAGAAFLGAVNGIVLGSTTGHMCCVHRYRGHTIHPDTGRRMPTQLETPLKSYITGASVDTRIDSQRRRLGPDR